jgi:DMSO/TMAO reductase YedYZ molybdopterin-dependent catalytic subunit
MYADGVCHYESIGLEDAHHPRTILTHELNSEALPVKNGATIRVRIDPVADFKGIRGGKGGNWEDQGDGCYAGTQAIA